MVYNCSKHTGLGENKAYRGANRTGGGGFVKKEAGSATSFDQIKLPRSVGQLDSKDSCDAIKISRDVVQLSSHTSHIM